MIHLPVIQQANRRKVSLLLAAQNVWMSINRDGLSDLLILYLAQRERFSLFSCSVPRECDYRPSGQNWPQIDLHFIDQPLVERLTKNFAATLDQHAGDAAFPQILQYRRQGFSFINQSSCSKFVGQEVSLAWQLT